MGYVWRGRPIRPSQYKYHIWRMNPGVWSINLRGEQIRQCESFQECLEELRPILNRITPRKDTQS